MKKLKKLTMKIILELNLQKFRNKLRDIKVSNSVTRQLIKAIFSPTFHLKENTAN